MAFSCSSILDQQAALVNHDLAVQQGLPPLRGWRQDLWEILYTRALPNHVAERAWATAEFAAETVYRLG